jgi:uncharacterized protein
MRGSQKKNDQIADCEMVFGGQRLGQSLLPLATSVSVDLAVGKPGMFTLEMEGYDENQGLKWMESSVFALGTTVEVKMGYKGSLTSLFYGEVVGMDASFSSSGPPHMTVRAYDLSHRLTRGEKRRAFCKLKYSDIAQMIASEAGLTPKVTESGDVHEYVAQNGQSDMAFLLKLAEEIHYHLFVVRKEMFFQPVSNNSSASLKMSLDDDLVDFHPSLSLARQVSEVVVLGWDAEKRAEIEGRAQAGQEATTMGGQKSASRLLNETFGGQSKAIRVISDHPVMTQSEADRLAHAHLDEASLNLIEAAGTTMGNAGLLPGHVVEISGVSKWFSGRYYLTGTIHRYDYTSGYTTSFNARRNAL